MEFCYQVHIREILLTFGYRSKVFGFNYYFIYSFISEENSMKVGSNDSVTRK